MSDNFGTPPLVGMIEDSSDENVAFKCIHGLNLIAEKTHRFDFTSHTCHYCGITAREHRNQNNKSTCRRTMEPAKLQ